ncbi:MAG: HD domain-containing protein [Bacteroidales bacterium]|nr:HD domain-containing protein [Bacteroidales bacterium]
MDNKSLSQLKEWFTGYVQTFKSNDTEIQENINLKQDHTLRVCQEIICVGKQLGLPEDALQLAEAIALLHDIGRFEQYARYRTFMDGRSENHAELGIKVLLKHEVLKQLDDEIRDLILCAIKYHNRPSLPPEETDRCLFFSRILRDADKLDIWKVVIDHYYRRNSESNTAIELHLPDTPGFSKEVGRDLLNQRIVDMNHIKNLNDFKLLQMGWIFDINFKPTFDCIRERRYIELIQDVLPQTKEYLALFDSVYKFCHEHNFAN